VGPLRAWRAWREEKSLKLRVKDIERKNLIKGDLMAKIRHIAYRAEDVDAMAKFFIEAMGMKMIQQRKNNAIDLSDGTVNITVLPLRAGTHEGEPAKQPGIDHIGFSVDNDQEQFRLMEAAGARKAGAINMGTAYYEDKFVGPENIIIDIGHWQGAAPLDKEGQ
jgi:catechol 2,3-dioxygenase-like lactoylglutathione lyase family enzyme